MPRCAALALILLSFLPRLAPAEDHAERMAAARKTAAAMGAAEQATAAKEGTLVRIVNRYVLVALDEATGRCQVTWLKDLDAAAWDLDFAVEVNGQTLAPRAVAAQIGPVEDKLGKGIEVRQSWGEGVRVERALRVYDGKPSVVIAGRLENRTDKDVTLGAARIADGSAPASWWHLGDPRRAPGAVYVTGRSVLHCEPASAPGEPPAARDFKANTVLAVAHDQSAPALLVGYLSGREADPDLAAQWKPGEGGRGLATVQSFLGRKMRPRSSLELDAVYLSAEENIDRALARYANAVAATSPLPVRRGANSLWCSWYAHRMAMTEGLVLANAAVAAKHFKPLGMEVIQLDHGWQRGDITGDWIAGARFPHGLKWLADELQKRHGMKLGVWIAPTDVAQTSQTFREHPDWMLLGDDGKPLVSWRWFWVPNPDCYALDASQPDAEKFIRETFARLSAEGVAYYKIDFISLCGGERFTQHDPYTTRGWGVLRRAMEAVRQGAGPEVWIRYCQAPPLLAVGLADSAYGGQDTADAGLGGKIGLLDGNARSLAAGYWINDRLYHREVCDMSVRMQAPVEEVRMRLAMMALAGCSVSYSDEFQYLPPSRIHLMQQALPPGSPPMRPLDLLERAIPSVWHVHAKTACDEWDVVGLFNFADAPQDREVDLSRLGIPAGAKTIAFEFWEEKLLGVFQDRIKTTLPPQSSRILILRRAADRPQLIATDMHLLGGYHEVQRLGWDGQKLVLSGSYRRAAGMTGKAFFHVPAEFLPHFDFPLGETSARLTNIGGGLWAQEVRFENAEMEWSIPFDGPAQKPEQAPKVEPSPTS